ncbi:class I SAM-dependent methyltransferase [Acinetobacter sichuanensis]|uniref:class I SAM-dependent methyltransferase n=1 Tax=Acinetobacter sichuanensis TaxID=2136183 RepID=UPI00280E3F0B|nr:class I SAM-dependent methyltransferase [Acinetobacter sichuanensis]MDQ9021391.1 class I SAM-dependent methyltransferase [Acinetobacter sichuanensis]
MAIQEVASPIDLRNPQDAALWASEANEKRPWRYEFFNYYSRLINNLNIQPISILELGSGPGFLAQYLLEKCANIDYSALDFSEAMHELSRSKLSAQQLEKTTFYVADFKTTTWADHLPQYDVIIIHQALHELRHKSYALNFHCQVRKLLKPTAIYLVCDHIFAPHAMQNHDLYMSTQEHVQSLKSAGFKDIDLVMQKESLCLFECKA